MKTSRMMSYILSRNCAKIQKGFIVLEELELLSRTLNIIREV